MREKQTETDDRVKLKPFMGIRPGHYLTAIYSAVLLGVLFFLLVFPGLKAPGAVLRINAEPQGAAIRVDGVYMGTSTDRIFVSKGEHVLEAVLPGFETESVSAQIPGRVFGSLFFPRRFPITFTLKTTNAAAVLAQAAADYAAWSFGGEPTAAWQIPPDLCEGAYRAGPENDAAAAEILTAAARFAVTRAALRDLIRAKILLDNSGLSPSPAGLIHSASDILTFLSENSGSAQWLSGLLPPESAAIVKASAWYKNETAYSADTGERTAAPARRLTLAGISFAGVENNSFMISENPVSRSLFETFLDENPSWKEQNETDPAQMFSVFSGGDEITGISWFAAEAFCQWLSKRLPMAGMEARLPTESEWEAAALSGAINTENSVWEWCADPFAPLQFIKASSKAIQAVGSPERSLRGLSSKNPETRASMPPEFTSPFVTFRPVIAEKDSE